MIIKETFQKPIDKYTLCADEVAVAIKEHLRKYGYKIRDNQTIEVNGVFIGKDDKSYQTFLVR
jgi:hypothetical protein